ncbi:unnamed protein product [Staurois parvus]|uniref:Uncharacterized protein n=1 Tax=Staurois parvus TaxID=386267 RepID=A0ABN9CLD8_9NEOB|nr:unnamed protein product [Staurois parvus]
MDTGGHMWVCTGGWHCWAQVGGTLGGTVWHCTAGHRWVHCWAQVGRNWWVALLGTDHQDTDHQCPDDLSRSLL